MVRRVFTQHPKLIITGILLVLLLLGFSYARNSSVSHDRSDLRENTPAHKSEENTTQQSNESTADSPAPIGNKPTTQPETTPNIIVVDFSAQGSKNKISYTASIKNAVLGNACTLTANNSANQSISTSSTSTVEGCSGSIDNNLIAAGDSWSLTLSYRTSSKTVIARKVIIVK